MGKSKAKKPMELDFNASYSRWMKSVDRIRNRRHREWNKDNKPLVEVAVAFEDVDLIEVYGLFKFDAEDDIYMGTKKRNPNIPYIPESLQKLPKEVVRAIVQIETSKKNRKKS